MQKFLRILGPIIGLFLMAAAFWALHHMLKEYRISDVRAAFQAIPTSLILWAIILSVLSYLVMTSYDAMALRYVEHPIPYSRIALISFIGCAFTNSMGLSFLSGGAVRYRMYSAWNLNTAQIAKVVVFCAATTWMGFIILTGAGILLEPEAFSRIPNVPASAFKWAGIVLVGAPALYMLATLFLPGPVTLRRRTFTLPSFPMALGQLFFSTAEIALAAGALYLLMPKEIGVAFPAFMALYSTAVVAGFASQVPGGLGVFETIILLLLPREGGSPEVIMALFLFRIFYYLAPLGFSTLFLTFHETRRQKGIIARYTAQAGVLLGPIAPLVLGFVSFLSGAALLFSSATPALEGRLFYLREVFWLPVIEVAHIGGSMVGIALILLSRPMQHRIRPAFWYSIVLLVVGIACSLLRGYDYEIALILAVVLAMLFAARGSFYRKGSIWGTPAPAGWSAAVAIVLLGGAWLGLFSYKDVDYETQLFWLFGLNAEMPRFLRAGLGVMATVTIFVGARVLKGAPPKPVSLGPGIHPALARVIAVSSRTSANLACLGDKRFLFSDNGKSFIMFAEAGRNWVALGDPVGPSNEWADVIWRFQELCERNHVRPVFYGVHPEHLYMYTDIGLTHMKIGEEARVRLAREESSHLTPFDSGDAEPGEFLMLLPERVRGRLPELERLARHWNVNGDGMERAFSIGHFTADYIARFHLALVQRDGVPLAFGPVWTTANKQELAIDFVLCQPGLPPAVWQGLVTRTMAWGKEQGYALFNLGMLPSADLDAMKATETWNRFGTTLFRFGEHFSSVAEMQAFKSSFGVSWTPVYLASPGGVRMPRLLVDIASLIAPGLVPPPGRRIPWPAKLRHDRE